MITKKDIMVINNKLKQLEKKKVFDNIDNIDYILLSSLKIFTEALKQKEYIEKVKGKKVKIKQDYTLVSAFISFTEFFHYYDQHPDKQESLRYLFSIEFSQIIDPLNKRLKIFLVNEFLKYYSLFFSDAETEEKFANLVILLQGEIMQDVPLDLLLKTKGWKKAINKFDKLRSKFRKEFDITKPLSEILKSKKDKYKGITDEEISIIRNLVALSYERKHLIEEMINFLKKKGIEQIIIDDIITIIKQDSSIKNEKQNKSSNIFFYEEENDDELIQIDDINNTEQKRETEKTEESEDFNKELENLMDFDDIMDTTGKKKNNEEEEKDINKEQAKDPDEVVASLISFSSDWGDLIEDDKEKNSHKEKRN